MPIVKQEFKNNCGPAKTHMVQYDIPGKPKPGSKWLVTIQMTSRNGNWANGGYTELVVFSTSMQQGKDRGWLRDGCYISWSDFNNNPSCNGYSTLVQEDGQRSRFKAGRKILKDATNRQSGTVWTVSYSFTLPESGAGLSFAVLGGQYNGSYDELKIQFVGNTIDM